MKRLFHRSRNESLPQQGGRSGSRGEKMAIMPDEEEIIQQTPCLPDKIDFSIVGQGCGGGGRFLAF
jgi:hypothetical protein